MANKYHNSADVKKKKKKGKKTDLTVEGAARTIRKRRAMLKKVSDM